MLGVYYYNQHTIDFTRPQVTMITLQRIGAESTELLAKLGKLSFVQAYKDIHCAQDIEQYCKEHYSHNIIQAVLCDQMCDTVAAFNNSQVVGFYTIKQHSCPVSVNGQATELSKLYLLEDHYGTGLAMQLFDDLKATAIKNGSKWLWLCVSAVNYRAQTFYFNLGFTQLGEGPQLLVGEDALESLILLYPLN